MTAPRQRMAVNYGLNRVRFIARGPRRIARARAVLSERIEEIAAAYPGRRGRHDRAGRERDNRAASPSGSSGTWF